MLGIWTGLRRASLTKWFWPRARLAASSRTMWTETWGVGGRPGCGARRCRWCPGSKLHPLEISPSNATRCRYRFEVVRTGDLADYTCRLASPCGGNLDSATGRSALADQPLASARLTASQRPSALLPRSRRTAADEAVGREPGNRVRTLRPRSTSSSNWLRYHSRFNRGCALHKVLYETIAGGGRTGGLRGLGGCP